MEENASSIQSPHKKEDTPEQNAPPVLPIAFPIIVIGASAGGIEPMKKLVAGLPKDFPAALFVVWHMSPDVRGILPEILNKANTIYAANAYDGEPISPNRIYVAPPDHHLLVEEGKVRITRGPKENRFRPAVDPLFRSAAYVYTTSVIGVVLSGALDDGTAGLWTIKHHGGTGIVQDPLDAEVASMPESAVREVAVDYCVPASEIAGVLVGLVNDFVVKSADISMEQDNKIKIEVSIAAENAILHTEVLKLGELTPFTCPECHGVLVALTEGNIKRFRCHTGHAFSTDSLLSNLGESIEQSLWSAIRSIEESMLLLNHLGDHYAEVNQSKVAARYFTKANEAEKRALLVKQVVTQHEQLSKYMFREQANGETEAAAIAINME